MNFPYELEESAQKLTGFEMIEIKKAFKAPFTKLDGELHPYALYYALGRREDPTLDSSEVMALPFEEITGAFKPADDDAAFRDGA